MGTNFYFMCTDKSLVRESFAINEEWGVHDEEYEIVDEPYLGYNIHLNKLSCGWKPLFQKHKAFSTFSELKDFYFANEDKLKIYDEYGKEFSWDEYFERVYSHSAQKREPVRWVYEPDKRFNETEPTLHFIHCEEAEADLFTPFAHIEYSETEKVALKRFGIIRGYEPSFKYWNDPDFFFDWTEGEFC